MPFWCLMMGSIMPDISKFEWYLSKSRRCGDSFVALFFCIYRWQNPAYPAAVKVTSCPCFAVVGEVLEVHGRKICQNWNQSSWCQIPWTPWMVMCVEL
jgi:hypothetical protein